MNDTTPRPLADLLHVQEGAIVSRVLLKNRGGNVTLFAFDAGEGLSEHTAPYDALITAVDGTAEVDIADQTHIVTTGDVITLPANVPHALRATSAFKMLLIMVRE